MDINNLQRQHNKVRELVQYILESIKTHNIEQNINELAKNINMISGKLKIHLMNEDKYLYPKLISSVDEKLQIFGRKYNEEMESVTAAYEKYKDRYNTASKIRANIDVFAEDTVAAFNILENRIGREEEELYPLLENKDLEQEKHNK